jgi:hypothetical protein
MPSMNRRGRIIALWTAAVALVVLAAAGVVGKDRIRKEWYLSRLQSPDWETRSAAAATLGECKSLRAVPRLIELALTEPIPIGRPPGHAIPLSRIDDGQTGYWMISNASYALWMIGKGAAPELLKTEEPLLRRGDVPNQCMIFGIRQPIESGHLFDIVPPGQ